MKLWTSKDISDRIAEHAQEHHRTGAQCILVEYAGRAMHHMRGDFLQQMTELEEEMDALLIDLAECSHRITELEAALLDAYNLSGYMAAINWNGERNTNEWLGELAERIEAFQRTAHELGVQEFSMSVEDRKYRSIGEAQG